jgi:hypothetical protein
MAGGGSSSGEQNQEWQKAAGITISVIGSFLTGLAFVLQKMGHMSGGEIDPVSTAYFKSPVWWLGMLSRKWFSALILAKIYNIYSCIGRNM